MRCSRYNKKYIEYQVSTYMYREEEERIFYSRSRGEGGETLDYPSHVTCQVTPRSLA